MTSTETPSDGAPVQTILVVDAEILIRFHIAGYLRECGFRVIEAASADEALVVLQEPDLPVDLVLSDVEMPGSMDGFGLSKWVRANRPGLPVVLAASPARATEMAGDLCESGPLLAKPYEQQILFDRIKRTLADPPRG
jgi:DNA-binding response OmpR family regulator